MRTTYPVCYDIADDKRLRHAFKTCRNFGDHLQSSVFECDLNPAEKIELEEALNIGEIEGHLRRLLSLPETMPIAKAMQLIRCVAGTRFLIPRREGSEFSHANFSFADKHTHRLSPNISCALKLSRVWDRFGARHPRGTRGEG